MEPYETKTVVKKIPTEFEVKFYYDEMYDTSHMGHFSNNWESGAIDRELSGDLQRHEYRYWIPTPGGENWEDYKISCRKWYTDHGYSKHEAGIAAHQHRAQDYQRVQGLLNQDWHYMIVEVSCAWGEFNLGGIESDSDESYIDEVINDLIISLIDQKSITVRIR